MVHGLPTLIRQNELASKTHTPGPWRKGKGGTVVCDTPVPEIGGADAVDYYGDHMICESVVGRNIPIIAAAPELLEQLKEVLDLTKFLDPTPDVRKVVGKSQELIRRIEQCPT